ncbi:alpha/beta fold hydrolase [Mariniblastus sp.]|nr:alpha/beta fold hydrolase [Mariniblastus sp.]
MPSKRISFQSSDGLELAGVIEMPEQEPLASAIFAHCFTCSKDLKATVRVSRQLASLGFLTLRFDFRGVGDSQGQFEHSNFQTNVADLCSAIDWLAETHQPPKVMIGHSLGGAAAMSVAARAGVAKSGPLSQLAALVTLAAPSDTSHLAEFLLSQNPDIQATGVGDVSIGGKAWPISMQLIESLKHSDLEHEIQQIRMPHLILHSPDDATVAYRHAQTLLQRSGGLTSLISLDDSDHLLVKQKQDVAFVANMITTWAKRYV